MSLSKRCTPYSSIIKVTTLKGEETQERNMLEVAVQSLPHRCGLIRFSMIKQSDVRVPDAIRREVPNAIPNAKWYTKYQNARLRVPKSQTTSQSSDAYEMLAQNST